MLQCTPIIRPSTPTNSTPQTMEYHLSHLAAPSDDHPQYTVIQKEIDIDTNTSTSISTPSSTTLNESSTCHTPSSTDSNISTFYMASDRQLFPHVPINYKETLLRRLHGHPWVRILNNMLLPLELLEDTDEDNESENSSKNMSCNNESDTNTNSEPDTKGFAVCIFIHFSTICPYQYYPFIWIPEVY